MLEHCSLNSLCWSLLPQMPRIHNSHSGRWHTLISYTQSSTAVSSSCLNCRIDFGSCCGQMAYITLRLTELQQLWARIRSIEPLKKCLLHFRQNALVHPARHGLCSFFCQLVCPQYLLTPSEQLAIDNIVQFACSRPEVCRNVFTLHLWRIRAATFLFHSCIVLLNFHFISGKELVERKSRRGECTMPGKNMKSHTRACEFKVNQ